MEPRFKTSFIPKTSLPAQGDGGAHAASPKRGSTLLLSAGVLFIASLTAAGALYAYRSYLVNDIAYKADLLQEERKSIDPALIRAMARHMARIEAAKKILAAHIAPTVLFSFLEEITLENVRYASMRMAANEGSIQVALQGEATNFEAVALQSDVYGNNRMVRRALFSDVNRNSEGLVLFNVDATMDPRFLRYGNYLTLRAKGDGAVSDTPDTAGDAPAPSRPTSAEAPPAAVVPQEATPSAGETGGDAETDAGSSEGAESPEGLLPPPPAALP